jgi:hypothetical protein
VNLLRTRFLLLCLTLAGSGPALAGPIEICEHKSYCSATTYPIIKNRRCEKACVPNTQPPGVDMIDCDYSWGSYQCEVWPRGDEISYSYSASPGLQVSWSGPTYAPFVSVDCPGTGRGGTLVVTVTSPYGISSTDSISLPCRTMIEP